jgi:PHD/YefM family antitoxin component YafN of YafNO toxin-antitoxin module
MAIDLAEDIRSLTEFKRETPALLKRMKKTGRPLVLTINGKAAAVTMDVAAFQKLIDAVDRAEAVDAIDSGLKSMARGEGQSVASVFRAVRRKHGISG